MIIYDHLIAISNHLQPVLAMSGFHSAGDSHERNGKILGLPLGLMMLPGPSTVMALVISYNWLFLWDEIHSISMR